MRRLGPLALALALVLGFSLGRALPEKRAENTQNVDYFAAFCEKRQALRALELDASDPDTAQALLDRCRAETACELALSVRYPQCAVLITDRGVFAAVRASGLTPQERAALSLILCRETGLDGASVFLTAVPP